MQVPYLSAAFGAIYVLVKPAVSIWSHSLFFRTSGRKGFQIHHWLIIVLCSEFLDVQTYAVISKGSSSVNQVCKTSSLTWIFSFFHLYSFPMNELPILCWWNKHLFLMLKLESALWAQLCINKMYTCFQMSAFLWMICVPVAHKFKYWFISGKSTGIYCRCPVNSKFIIPTCNESIDLWVAGVYILSLVTTTSIQFCLLIDELLFQPGSSLVMHLSTVKVSAS